MKKDISIRSPKRLLSLIMTLVLILGLLNGFTAKVEAIANDSSNASAYFNTATKTLHMGDKATSTFDFNVKKRMQMKGASYIWYINQNKGNPNAIVINKNTGVVKAKRAGTAYIHCKITLPDGDILRPEAKVIVRNNITEVDISNLPENNTIKAGTVVDFNRVILNTSGGKNVYTQGISRWEIKDDTAGIDSVDKKGILYPAHEGTFYIRSICFQSNQKYKDWLEDKELNGKNITASSKWCKIIVEDSAVAVVTTQEQIEKALTTESFENITLSSDRDIQYIIPSGEYLDKSLSVNTPNADVINKGVFKSIRIIAIKDSTWYELANGNRIYLSDDVVSFVVEPHVVIKRIVIDRPNSTINFDIQGSVEQIEIQQPSKVSISGNSVKVPIEVARSAQGSTIKASVPLIVSTNANIELQLDTGAEDTIIDRNESTVEVIVENQTQDQIVITTNNTNSIAVKAGSTNKNNEASITTTPTPTTVMIPPVIQNPTSVPTVVPSLVPTSAPTVVPTSVPMDPTATPMPTSEPTATPMPTSEPTATPMPTSAPTAMPITPIPTEIPTATPTDAPPPLPNPTATPTPTTPSITPPPVPDYVPPTIILNGNTVIYLFVGDEYSEPGYTASDNIDGDITDQVSISGFNSNGAIETRYEGIYRLVYMVIDSSGNATYEKRTIIITNPDTSKQPVIVLQGADIYGLVLGMQYVDDGAIAWDYEDGDITSQIKVSGDTVNVNQEGLYKIYYNVTDSHGNHAIQAERTVIITDPENPKDFLPPDLYINGPIEYYVNIGDEFMIPNANAWDHEDGDLDDSIVVTGEVDVNAIGDYQLIYSVSDKAGNQAKDLIITVRVRDFESPILTLKGNPVIYINKDEPFNDPGVTAFDNLDGDISDQVLIYGDVIDNSIEGEYYIQYEVRDSSNNFNYITRTVIITGEEQPQNPSIYLLGNVHYWVWLGQPYEEPGAVAGDYQDGNITNQIMISGDVIDENQEGLYTIYYSVTDSDGNIAQISRQVAVMNPDSPVDYFPPYIWVIGPVYLEHNLGDPYIELGVEAWDEMDGHINDKIVVTGEVNVNEVGAYELVYTVTDSAGYEASTKRWVQVIDRTAPTISLLGKPVEYIQLGESYIDPGVVAIDNVDGDISDLVNSHYYIDSSVEGTYSIWYEVCDSNQNYSNAIRYVVVADLSESTAPHIFLDSNFYTIHMGYEYFDAGFYAWDYEDGDITDQIIKSGDFINTNQAGLYTIIYDVMDSDGNRAQQVIRKVAVFDPQNPKDYYPPYIDIHSPIYYRHNIGDAFVYPGASASDDVDGDISDRIIVTGDVNVNIPGIYEIVYRVTDAAGNETSATITVEVDDLLPPLIDLNGTQFMYLSIGEEFVDPGVIAIDNYDGDVSDLVLVSGGDFNTNYPGTYIVQYQAKDNKDNYSYMERVVVVANLEESMIPNMYLIGGEYYYLWLGDVYYEEGAIAWDYEDGNITNQIMIGGDAVDTNQPGYYLVTYDVIDSGGNVADQITRKVAVVDPNNPRDYIPPVIWIISYQHYEHNLGDPFTDPGVYVWDDVDGDINSQVEVTGEVDANTPGLYKLVYTVTDLAGNEATAERIVIVKDMTKD